MHLARIEESIQRHNYLLELVQRRDYDTLYLLELVQRHNYGRKYLSANEEIFVFFLELDICLFDI